MVTQPNCEFTDAVLAHFLDGETRPLGVAVDGATRLWTAEELARHRGECDECTLQLAAARRLDALFAATASIDVNDEDAARLFRGVENRLTPVAIERTRRTWSTVCAAVVCGFVGFGVAHWLRDDPVVTSDPVVVRAPVESAEEQRDDGIIVLHGSRRSGRRIARPSQVEDEELEALMLFSAWARSSALGLRRDFDALRVDARRAVEEMRIDEVVGLAARDTRSSVLECVDRIASMRGFLRERVLESVRGEDTFVRRLSRIVRDCDSTAVEVSTQVGGKVLDRAVAGFVQRDVARGDLVASVLADVQRRPGRVTLLLELWDHLRVRGDVEDDYELADRWFTPQPEECSRQLLRVLRDSRDADERRSCLIALACRADSTTSAAMMAVADGPRQDEAELAAYALGRLPVDADELARRPLRRSYLRLSALASRRDPITDPHLRNMRLSDEERAFLLSGRFNEQQFKIAVALCRERSVEPIFSDD